MSKQYENKSNTYEIFIVETGEVIEKCRLKATAIGRLPELKSTIKEKLEIRKVK